MLMMSFLIKLSANFSLFSKNVFFQIGTLQATLNEKNSQEEREEGSA